MNFADTIKRVFRRRPLTAEELAAIAEDEAIREQLRIDVGAERDAQRNNGPGQGVNSW